MDEREHAELWRKVIREDEERISTAKAELAKADAMIADPARWCGQTIAFLEELRRTKCSGCPPIDARFAKCQTGPRHYKVTYEKEGVEAWWTSFIHWGGASAPPRSFLFAGVGELSHHGALKYKKDLAGEWSLARKCFESPFENTSRDHSDCFE